MFSTDFNKRNKFLFRFHFSNYAYERIELHLQFSDQCSNTLMNHCTHLQLTACRSFACALLSTTSFLLVADHDDSQHKGTPSSPI